MKETKPKRHVLDQSPEVVRRWIQMKMGKKGQALGRRAMRIWLPFKERKKTKALEGAFDAIKNQAINSERRGYAASATIFNIALYLLIAHRDIQAVKIDALTHPDEWKRKLCARVILLTLHEWDMDKVSGKKLRTALSDVKASEGLVSEAHESLRQIRTIQHKAKKELGFLRNATIAHRDPNALGQYRAIRDLDTTEVMHMAAEFYGQAGRFITCVPKLIIEANSLDALIRQLLVSGKRKHAGRPA